MSKYEVMSNGIKIEIEADAYEDNVGSERLNFYNYNEDKKLCVFAEFKEWSYVRKV